MAALAAYWLGLSVHWGAITTIVLPRLVELAAPAAIKATSLAAIAALEAVVGIVVQPLSGAASDRWTGPGSRWGRRRPLIVAGVSLQLIALALLARAETLLVIAGAIVLVEIASNLAQGPYQGLLPDLVPRGGRGLVSGLMGGAQLAGQVVGVAAAGVAIAAGQLWLAIVLSGAAIGIGAAVTVLGVPEAPRPGAHAERADAERADAERVGTGRRRAGRRSESLLSALRTVVLRTWDRDVLDRHDYVWLLASRLAILMATGTLQPFVYFLLKDSFGLGDDAGLAVAPLAGVVAIVALISAVPGGALSGRFGRVRTVRLSAVVGAVAALLFAVAPTYASLFVMAVPFGLALGVFLSADWALLADLAPADEAGRYLGLSNTVTAAASLLAVALGGPLADLVNGIQFGAGYRAIFVLAAVEFLVGAWCVSQVREPAPVGA
jgi:MFS family permease